MIKQYLDIIDLQLLICITDYDLPMYLHVLIMIVPTDEVGRGHSVGERLYICS